MVKPTRQEAEAAVKTLIAWAGDNPEREGLVETPKRLVKAYEEYFSGYGVEPKDVLGKTFEEVQGYKDPVILTNIDFQSHCEHHIAPIIGQVHVAYYPTNRVVGISKIVRLINVYARRLQVQEAMTSQIARSIDEHLQAKGVAVVIRAKHQCMTTRGVRNPNVDTLTTTFLGEYQTNADLRNAFLMHIQSC